jgi:patatin-like phospholipase/acyl hydrolase
MRTGQEEDKPKRINVLSIDGGGIRGIIPAMLLAEIESITGKRICQLFDIIAGTSTGGILALALTKPQGPGSRNPAFKASELVELYEKNGRVIFPKSAWGKFGTIFRAEYPAVGLERLLDQYFGDARLKDALNRVIITSYDIENKKAFFFRSANAKIPVLQGTYDFPMKQVARATSAAPTYFRPARIPKGTPEEYWALIDGGVYANNPTMCAYVEALGLNPDAEICVVSLGTGAAPPLSIAKQADTWGLIGWARPIVSITLEGPGDTVDYQMNRLLRAQNYYRLQAELNDVSDAMDNTDASNISRLKELTQAMITEQSEHIKKACARLLENKKVRTKQVQTPAASRPGRGG